MTREFVLTSVFYQQWNELGLTEKDLSELEIHLMENPKQGDVIPGTSGLRKLRIPINK